MFTRPSLHLRTMPIKFRWEATRRHPNYQAFWQIAERFYSQVTPVDELESLLRQFAVAMLAGIGVSGRPPSPQTKFSELGASDLNSAWASGAVHPVTLRGLLEIVLARIPGDVAALVGEVFQTAAIPEKEGDFPSIAAAAQKLSLIGHETLDSIPTEPFVSINPNASERQLTSDLRKLLKQWKKERALKEKRVRPEKFSQLFKVWDQREGWKDGHYSEPSQSLKAVAQRQKVSPSTVAKQYQRAFELITGQPYSPPVWLDLFGVLKLSVYRRVADDPISLRRPQVGRSSRAVPETVLHGGRESGAGVIDLAMSKFDRNQQALVERIREMISNGSANAEIIGQLELPARAAFALENYRDHVVVRRRTKK
jgi:hypothetical protein